ncbi:hypothetical protein GCM10027610_038300 [Dactylosporangium cerinum]
MDADDVEGVVVAELVLEADGVAADDAGDGADGEGAEGVDGAAGGVIPTRPATAPEAAPRVVGWPSRQRSTMSQPPTAAAPATWVLKNAVEATPPVVSAEPALKPNQPNHSRPAPRMTSGRLCGRIASVRKPSRGPSTRARARADAPELTSTTVPPARSRMRRWVAIHPPPKTQCAIGTYTTSTQIATKPIQAPNFARSAIAPLSRAAVMMANISWKPANAMVGTEPVRSRGPMPAIPACSREPIRPPAVSVPNARL